MHKRRESTRSRIHNQASKLFVKKGRKVGYASNKMNAEWAQQRKE